MPRIVASFSRSKGPKCARQSAPSLWATVLVSFKGPMYGKPQPVPLTRALFCQEWLHQFRDRRVQSVLDCPPPHSKPLFWLLSRDPCTESPNKYFSTETYFARNGCISFAIQGSKVCSTIRPLTLGHCFGFFQRTHVWKAPTCTFHYSLVLPRMAPSVSRSKGPKCAPLSAPSLWATVLVSFKGMESPNQYFSPEPCFARNGSISFEIQRSKVCSTIRPLTLGHCFGFFQGTHVWKAPTSVFDQSLVLPGMVASLSRSIGRKCAGLSAPSQRHNKHSWGWKHEWMPTGSSVAVAVHFSCA